MSTNVFQPFFDQLDQSVAVLSGRNDDIKEADLTQAVDLLRRAGFVLANLLNAQAQIYPHLILETTPEVVESLQPEAEGRSVEPSASESIAEGAVESSPEQPESPAV